MQKRSARSPRGKAPAPLSKRKAPAAFVEPLEQRIAPATFLVTNALDTGTDSLRDAITQANATPGPDLIQFNIGGTGPHVIALDGALPVITEALTIDGYSQVGSSPNTLGAGFGTDALPMIVLDGPGVTSPTLTHGLRIAAPDSKISGLVIGDFSGAGILITSPATRTSIEGNFLGTTFAGTSGMGNGRGVEIFNSEGNTIGGVSVEARNLISGNVRTLPGYDGEGIAVINPGSQLNLIQGNLIGTRAGGGSDLGNQGDGILLNNAPKNQIGGPSDSFRNVISGNALNGVRVFSSSSTDNSIFGNYIGLNAAGNQSVPNLLSGVKVQGGNTTQIGGESPGVGNVISGNLESGVEIFSGTGGNVVLGNLIGTNAMGLNSLGNGFAGVTISSSSGNIIGKVPDPLIDGGRPENFISGNGTNGIAIFGISDGNSILNNTIGIGTDGVTAVANTGDGIQINDNVTNTTVGGVLAGEANRISNNTGNGVRVTGSSASGNTIRGNSIADNGGLGIDLAGGTQDGFGVTANDVTDSDVGPNGLTNFPTLMVKQEGTTAFVSTLFQGLANQEYTVDLYVSGSADPSGFGEGSAFLRSVVLMTDGSGRASADVTQMGTSPMNVFSATATGTTDRSTSEFSPAVMPLVVDPLVVTTTDDSLAEDGVTSLREAITFANSSPGTNTITFAILGGGVRTITPTSALPTLTGAVIIDGYSQSGSVRNSLPLGNNAVLLIELSGVAAGGATGLTFDGSAAGSTVTGLTINRFTGNGIFLNASSNNTFTGNFIGTDPTGLIDLGNGAAGIATGFFFASSNTLVGGTTPADRNILSGNGGAGFESDGGAGIRVQGNFIGLGADGVTSLGNGGGGVAAGSFTNGTLIGGDDAADGTSDGNVGARNFIGSNGGSGVFLGGSGFGAATVQGNYIGTDVTGTLARPNGSGIDTNIATNSVIGGSTVGAGNLISANVLFGIRVAGTGGVVIKGNTIGLQADGISALGNTGEGISVRVGSSNTLIGGTLPGEGNFIAFNARDGVWIDSGTGNSVSGNSIHSNGTTVEHLPIDLEPNGVTLNDLGDGDTGPNDLQNFPVLSNATISGSGFSVDGQLSSKASAVYAIQIFANAPGQVHSSGYGGGFFYLGTQLATTNDEGNVNFTFTQNTQLPPDTVFTATATEVATGNTSEFSLGAARAAIIVETEADIIDPADGAFSFREAIQFANSQPGPDIIFFAIPGSGPHVINVGENGDGALPTITGDVIVDGYSQLGSAENSAETGSNATLQIEIDGTNAGFANGLTLGGAGGSTVRGLIINNFGPGINDFGNGILIQSGGNSVLGNFIGTNAVGTADLGNGGAGVSIAQFGGGAIFSGNVIGGATPADRNVISGNSFGVSLGAEADNTVVAGNLIGTNAPGTSAIPNDNAGVFIVGANNRVGGSSPTERNIISGNSDAGVVISGGSSSTLFGNFIGLNANGTAALPNAVEGVLLLNGALNNIIGGSAPGQGNVISGNLGTGISLGDLNDGPASGTRVRGNLIGTDPSGTLPIPNASGIEAYSFGAVSPNFIGGSEGAEANIIRFNSGPGVFVSSSTTGIRIDENQISENSGLQIDLSGGVEDAFLVTANDPGDADEGANGLQNFPVLNGATFSAGGLSIDGTLSSKPTTLYVIELYANAPSQIHASGYGGGFISLGSQLVTTDSAGGISFNFGGSMSLPGDTLLTATATEISTGNTSEFSAAAALEVIYRWDGSQSADWFDGGNWDLGAVPGFSDTAILDIASTIDVNGEVSVGSFIQSAGVLTSTSAFTTFTIRENFTWSGGSQTGGNFSGTIVEAGATFTLAGIAGKTLDGRYLVVENAVVTGEGALTLAGGTELVSRGVFDIQTGADFLAGLGGGTFNVEGGTLLKSTGGSATQFGAGVVLQTTGSIEAQGSTLEFFGGGSNGPEFLDAAWRVGNGGLIRLGGGIFDLRGFNSFEGDGAFLLSGANLSLAAATLAGPFSVFRLESGTFSNSQDFTTGLGSTFAQSGGTLDGSAQFRIGGIFNWTGGTQTGATGTTVLESGATLNIGGIADKVLDRALNSSSTITVSGTGNLVLDDGAVITNSGLFSITSDANITDLGVTGPTFSNQESGIFQKSGGTDTSFISSFIAFNNAGNVTVTAGTLQFDGSFVQTGGATQLTGGNLLKTGSALSFQGGQLTGYGSIIGDVDNSGATVSPGGDLTPGTLAIIGNYTQGSGGTLSIELGGTLSGSEYDQLNVSGVATLDGTLSVALIYSYLPSDGQTFDVLPYGSHTGTFTNYIDSTGQLSPIYGATVLQLEQAPALPPLDPYIVTITGDIEDAGDNETSLREAIIAANSTSGAQTITFAIPGSGPQVIFLGSALPSITDTLTIDGFSQPGASANTNAVGGLNSTLAIEINGGSFVGTGLVVTSSGSVIRGLAIHSFSAGGIQVTGSSNRIEGSLLGTRANGDGTGLSGWGYAVRIDPGASDNIIGGSTPDVRNLITKATAGAGVLIQGDRAIVQGNLIGLEIGGTSFASADYRNVYGITVEGSGALIGGPMSELGNVISNNLVGGISLSGFGATGTVIEGNWIGTQANGFNPAPNSVGIEIKNGAGNNLIGGTTPGSRNVIAFNDGAFVSPAEGHGITVSGSGIGNAIRGNSIHDNAGLGINLVAPGDAGNQVTLNDPNDADSGPNELQNFPVITGVRPVDFSLQISGTFQGAPGTTYDLEFFGNSGDRDASGFGEGRSPILLQSITTDAFGNAAFAFGGLGDVSGPFTATATNTLTNSTSEFSQAFNPQDFVVTTASDESASDDGVVSLREAILAANSSLGVNTITFAIFGDPGTLHTIAPTSALPTITDAVIIDGYSQDGASANTLANGNDAVLLIELNGALSGGAGLTLSGGNSTVSGLIIGGFQDGIVINGPGADVITGNWIGLNASGTAAQPNADDGIEVNATNVTIGGSTPAARNVISGNGQRGIELAGGTGGMIVQGNFIGTNADGTAAVGNGEGGIRTGTFNINSPGVIIGGTAAGEGNVISGNVEAGVHVQDSNGVQIQGNLIGTNASGTGALGNATGVILNTMSNAVIGGSAAGARNVISGNTTGIFVFSSQSSAISGNYIGTSAEGTASIPNATGILLSGNSNATVIGGIGAGEGNLIAFNSLDGVNLSSGSNNTVRGNSIHSNTGLGIDLGGDGVTANDLNDPDAGPNGLQNYPVLTSVENVGTATTVSGTLNSVPLVNYLFDFFSSPSADPSGFGEGAVYLGSTTVNTDANGIAAFTFSPQSPLPLGTYITATATSAAGSTSEFSAGRVVVRGATTYVWDGGAGAGDQSWFNPLNWNFDFGVPGALDTAILSDGGTINLPSNTSVGTFQQVNGNFTSAAGVDLLVIDSFEWTGGSQSGAGSTTVSGAGTLNISGNGAKTLFTRAIVNDGTAVLSGANLGFATGTFTNNNQFTVSDGADFENVSGGGTFTNSATGTFTKSGATTTTFGTAVAFNNAGNVDVTGGALVLAGTGVAAGGTFTIGDAAALEFSNSYNLLATSTINGGGSASFTGGNIVIDGAYAISGLTTIGSNATVAFNNTATLPSLDLAGTLSGSGSVTVDGALNWTAGAMNGSGTTTIASTGTLNISGPAQKNLVQRTLSNSGTATLSGASLGFGSLGLFTNSGVFNATDEADLVNFSGSGIFRNTASGTFNKTGAGTTTSIGAAVTFENAGTVNVTSGTLQIAGGGTGNAGAVSVASGAALEFASNSFTFAAGTSVTGAGDVNFTAGTTNFDGSYSLIGSTSVTSGGSANFNGTANIATLNLSGSVGGSGAVTVTSALNWTAGTIGGSGSFTVANTAAFNLIGGASKTLTGRTLVNETTLTLGNGILQIGGAGTFLNNGVVNASVDSSFINASGGGTFSNSPSGTFNQSSPGTTTFGDFVGFSNAGLLNITSGVLAFSNSGFTQTGGSTVLTGGAVSIPGTLNLQGGDLRGAGTITGSVSNSGAIVRPGDGVGTLTITGSYTQGEGGTLAVELGGTGAGQFDVLNVGGNATLDGTLNIAHVNGFAPTAGDSFRIVQSANNPTTFTTLTGETMGIGQSADATGLTIARSAVAYTWDAGAGTDTSWFNPLNWDLDSGFPGAADTAVLGINATIMLPSNASVGTFIHTVGQFVGDNSILTIPAGVTLSVLANFTWSGGTENGAGTLVVEPGATFTFPDGQDTALSQRTLNLNGTSTFSNTTLETMTLSSGATINNSGMLELRNGFNLAGSGALNNLAGGTILGTTSAFLIVNNGVPFTNAGTVRAEAGTLGFNGSYVQTAGSSQLAGGSLNIATGLQLNGGEVAGVGTLAGEIINNGGVVRPGGAGVIGTLSTTGTYRQFAGGTLETEISGPGSGQIDVFAPAGDALINGGALNAPLLGGFTPASGSQFPVLTTGGNVVGTFATPPTTTGIQYNPKNVTLLGPTGPLTYIWDAGAGADQSWFNPLNWDRDSGFPTSADTAILQTSATIDLSGSGVSVDGFQQTSGSLTGDSTLNISNNFVWSGGSQIGSGATTLLSGGTGALSNNLILAGRTLTNAGTLAWTGGGVLSARDGAAFNNLADGILDLQADGAFQYGNSGANLAFTNAGTIIKTAGSGDFSFRTGSFENTGTVRSQGGAILFIGPVTAGGSFTADAGAALVFSGVTTVNGNVGFNNIDLTGAILTGSGAVSGDWRWNSGRISDAVLSIPVGSSVTVGGAADKIITSSTLNNSGTINLAGTGFLLSRDGPTLNNLAGGVFNVQSDTGLLYGNSGANLIFNNSGTLRKSSGEGTSSIAPGSFVNQPGALVEAQIGALAFSGPVTAGGVFTAAGGEILLTGATTITAAVAFNGVQLAGGSLEGTGTVSGSWTWSGGTLGAGRGTLTIPTAGILTLTGDADKRLDDYTITNEGVVVFGGAGNLISRDGAVFNNAATGVFDIQNDARVRWGSSGVDLAFNNSGTVQKSAGAGFSSFRPGVLTNSDSGIVVAQTGTIDLNGVVSTSGVFRATGGALTLTGATTVSGAPVFDNVELAAGTLRGTAAIAGDWRWSGGAITGGGVVTIASTGVLTLTGFGSKTLDGATLTNQGTIGFAGGDLVSSNGAALNNLLGGVLDIQADGALQYGNSGVDLAIANAGTLRKSAGAFVTTFSGSVTNSGILLAQSGTLAFGGSFTQAGGSTVLAGGNLSTSGNLNFQGGELSGSGTIAGNVVNTGAIVRPGGPDAFGSIAITGNYIQGSGATLEFEASGAAAGQFDQLNVAGSASLGGTLDVDLLAGYSPAFGTPLRVLQSNGNPGTFATLTGDTFGLSQQADATGLSLVRGQLTFVWDNSTGSGDWFEPLNWSFDNGIPTANDIAVLDSVSTINLSSDATVSVFRQSAGVFTSAPGVTFTITDQFAWTGGVQSGAGTTLLGSASTSMLSGAAGKVIDGRTLNNAGSLTWNDTGDINLNGGALNNLAGGTFIIANSEELNDQDGSGTVGSFSNAGTLRKITDSGTTSIAAFGAIDNSGTIDVQAGTLLFGTAFSNSGTVNVTGGSLVTAGNGVHTGSFDVSSGTTITFAGIQSFSGTISGAGAVAITGNSAWIAGLMSGSGTTTVVAGASLLLDGPSDKTLIGRTLNNDGVVQLSGNGFLFLAGGVVNNAGNFFAVSDASISTLDGGDRFNNQASGTYVKAGSFGVSEFEQGVEFSNSGIVSVISGTVAFNGGFTQASGSTQLSGGSISSNTPMLFQTGELTGSGTITGSVSNTGATVRPGGTGAVGLLTVSGAYTQGSSGTLAVELGGMNPGSNQDQLRVLGASSLGGALDIAFIGGYQTSPGEQFRVVETTNDPGSFATLTGSTAGFSQISDATGLVIAQAGRGQPDLSVVLADQTGSTTPGSTLTYSLTYKNEGSGNATGVFLTQTLPSGTSFNPAGSTLGWTETAPGSRVYTLNLGDVPAITDNQVFGVVFFSVIVDAVAPTGLEELVAVATISDDGQSGVDPTPANNTSEDRDALNAAPDLHVSVTDNGVTVPQGGSIRYSIAYGNLGNQNATGVFLTQTLPAFTTFNSGGSSAGWVETSPGVFQLNVGTLNAGQTDAIALFVVNAARAIPAPLTEFSSGSTINDLQANGADPSPGDNAATELTPIYKGIYALAPGLPRKGNAPPPVVRVFDAGTGDLRFQFDAYESTYLDSVRVAVGDFNGDGFDDIVTAARLESGRVRVFDGLTGTQFASPLAQIDPFSGRDAKGAFVAAGDVTGDGRDDIIVGSGLGGGIVKIFDGVTAEEVQSYTPFGRKFSGGVRVAVGDVNGDGVADVIVSQGNFGGRVKVYSQDTAEIIQDFQVGGKRYRDGIFVTAADLTGDGKAEIITGRDVSSNSAVETFDGATGQRLSRINPYESSYRGGSRVAAMDVNFDGIADIIVAPGQKGSSNVKIFDGATNSPLRGFDAIPDFPDGALFVAGTTPIPAVLLQRG